ncbi:hypothetical protein J6590_064192 [Homalodisca vitripennis]|nr:hypothetical protein J6590_064192 [Homalodisca vitripennis]
MFFFRRHQRGAAPKVLPKPALMAGGTRILGGGIKRKSVVTAATEFLEGVIDSIDRGDKVIGVFMDLHKAFDSSKQRKALRSRQASRDLSFE